MLPSMQTTTTINNNGCLLETERDVAHVEYDVINYYTDTNNPHPDIAAGNASASPQQRCSQVNNNTSLDVVVHARATREPAGHQATPTTSSNGGSGSSTTAPMRSKGGGNNNSSNGRQKNKEASGSSSSSSNSTPTLGVNMRVTGQCSQGGRKYMEDQFSVAYQESPLTHELEYAFFGIYDGHGGTEAALFAKEHLMLEIVKQKLFWSDNDEDVLRAIREGYIGTHFAMWREQDKWPRTANGHLSTAGTTATVAFMRREKIYIGHVGDSGIVLGYQNPNERRWRAKQLTTDHKPESLVERSRIQRSGGQVAIKSGVPRVVWNRPRDPLHRGPIKRRTLVDDIPFLAVARSLGDLWSYNSRCQEFVVSPDPDVKVVKINPNTFRCLIFGTDGLWNVVSAQEAVDSVREKHLIGECLHEQDVMNPSKALVDKALKTWATKKMRADNTSVVTVILSPASANATTRAANNSCADVEMLDLEPLDTENNFPSGLGGLDELDREMCGNIEEREYLHDMPYSALAKRHLPPEPYRNFEYYIEEEFEVEEEEEQEQDEEVMLLEQQNKFWRKSINQTVAAWQQSSAMRHRQHNIDDGEKVDMETESELESESEPEPTLDLYGNNSCNTDELWELEHSFDTYVSSAVVSAATEYSFAESYNSLLNEQQAARTHQQQQQSHQQSQLQQQQQQLQHQTAKHQHEQQMLSSTRSMQEILQEQQHYQQQEGYSLTQLETRREQQQQQQVANSSSRWQQSPYVEQPTELLALNELLQQERDEEHQVALEREQQQQQQQQQQLLLVEASSSSSSSASCSSSGQSELAYTSSWNENVATLQDNEVSSTLPATPTPTVCSSAEEEETDLIDIHYEQPLLPQQQEQQQQLLPQQLLQPEPKIKRQMRRYRNVPNENHQHMQTRRRQIFKHRKSKSFIATSAAAIVAYNNSEALTVPLPSSNSSTSINNNSNNNNNNTNNSSTSTSTSSSSNSNHNGNSKRRSVNSSAASAMTTRRSHSLSLASGGSVSKRQLRSSICQLGQLGNLDLTKRTLRTRNVTPAASNSSSTTSNHNNKNNNTNRSSNSNNNNKSNHTFNKPATPSSSTTNTTATIASNAVGSARRLRRSNEEREQRRSLRRSTLSTNQLGNAGGNSSTSNSNSQFSKPTRLQSSSGGIAARPPPSPKKLNTVVPTLAIGTRAYTAALAAAAHLSKRWSLRSSSSNSSNSSNNSNNSVSGINNNNAIATLVTAISCYSARNRTTTTAPATTTRRR